MGRSRAALALMVAAAGAAVAPAPAAIGTTYFLSPAGSDAHPGTTPDRPWRTFGRVLRAGTPLRPGDAIVLLDGTYTRDTTGLPDVDCRPGGTAPNGAPGSPIVLRAQNERRAHLAADGARDALQMQGCAHWKVWGLYGSNAAGTAATPWDGHVFAVNGSRDVTLQRLLAVHPNRRCPNDTLPTCNAHAIRVERSRRVLVEDVEAYDFHRHGVSVSDSRRVTVRRCYVHPRGAPGGLSGSTGLIFYGASDSIAENCVAEHTLGFNVAGTQDAGGTAGGQRNRLLGLVTLDNDYGSTIRARNFGGPVHPVADTVVRDSVFARSAKVGVFSRGAAGTLLANVTILGTRGDGFVADEDRGERAPCSANLRGCSIVARKVLSLANRGKGAQIDEGVVSSWRIESSTLAGNGGGDFPTAEDPRDGAGHIRHSSSVGPQGVGLAAGECVLWRPAGEGAHIGATVLYRYRDGTLTDEPLWDPATGAFPCGARVPGVNDVPGSSCFDVHQRLNVNVNGCAFPPKYAASSRTVMQSAPRGTPRASRRHRRATRPSR